MLTLETGMRSKRGFTLIEILVVIILIAIIASTALIVFGDFGSKKQTLITAQQFKAYLKLIQQQAILENRVFGIAVTPERYTTYRLINNQWQPIRNNRLLKEQLFPRYTRVQVTAPNQARNMRGPPNIVINSLGNITPLTLHFYASKTILATTLLIHNNGESRLSYAH